MVRETENYLYTRLYGIHIIARFWQSLARRIGVGPGLIQAGVALPWSGGAHTEYLILDGRGSGTDSISAKNSSFLVRFLAVVCS